MRLNAPWTPEQVDRLNRFQLLSYVHPFTCQNRHGEASRSLLATKDGWVCPHCNYKQDWAHDGMANEEQPPDPTIAWNDAIARERCAKVADAYAERCERGSAVSSISEDNWGAAAARDIAKAIRESKP